MRLCTLQLAGLALTGTLCSLPVAGQNLISAKSGLIHYTEGDVRIGDQSAAPNNGVFQSLANGKELRTGEGRAELLLGPGQFLRLNENSAVKMISNKLEATRVDVLEGSVMAELIEVQKSTPITLGFGSQTVELRKGGLYRIDVDKARFRVFEGEALVEGNGQSVTAKKSQEVSMGSVLAENSFDATIAGDEFSRWAERRAGYVATANVAAARSAYTSDNSRTPSQWYYDRMYGMYSYIPNNGFAMSPFGYPYFSSSWAYNDMFWPYLGFGGMGFGYGFGYGFYGYGAGYGYGYPVVTGYTGSTSGGTSNGGATIIKGRPVAPVAAVANRGNFGNPVNRSFGVNHQAVVASGVHGSASHGGYSNGMASRGGGMGYGGGYGGHGSMGGGGGGSASSSSARSSVSSAPSAPMGGGGAVGGLSGGARSAK